MKTNTAILLLFITNKIMGFKSLHESDSLHHQTPNTFEYQPLLTWITKQLSLLLYHWPIRAMITRLWIPLEPIKCLLLILVCTFLICIYKALISMMSELPTWHLTFIEFLIDYWNIGVVSSWISWIWLCLLPYLFVQANLCAYKWWTHFFYSTSRTQ